MWHIYISVVATPAESQEALYLVVFLNDINGELKPDQWFLEIDKNEDKILTVDEVHVNIF